MDNRHVIEDFEPSRHRAISQMSDTVVSLTRMVEPEEAWDRFIEHYAKKHGFVDKNGTITMKNFIGSIEGYKKEFIAAQKGQ